MRDLRERILQDREKSKEYQEDVTYEVWRRGGNIDSINEDRVQEAYENNLSSDYAVNVEMKRQKRR